MNRVDIKSNETKNFYEGYIVDVIFYLITARTETTFGQIQDQR
jgi:hypothetical protein